MTSSTPANVIVYVCANCLPEGGRLPRQWKQDDVHVLVREVPCSGKTDLQYLSSAFEGGARGVCVVACPPGECRLAEGNYRAEVRVHTWRRLLREIGIEPRRMEFVHGSPRDSHEQFDRLVRAAVGRIVALGESPVSVATPSRRITKIRKDENAKGN